VGYLIITRKISERIFIGNDIEIMISDIYSGKVDIAIKAPSDVQVHRKESHMGEQREFRNQSRKTNKRNRHVPVKHKMEGGTKSNEEIFEQNGNITTIIRNKTNTKRTQAEIN